MKTLKRILIVILTLIIAIFINGTCYVFIGQKKSVSKIERGEKLNLYECCSAYSMHMAVWIFGKPFSREAAYEARLMHIRHDNPVYVHNNFFIHSEVIRNSGKYPRWDANSYNINDSELRYALALNSVDTYVVWGEDINYCHVRVEYTDGVHSVMNIPVHTILFRYLQDIGWLHPYDMIYYDLMP